MMSLAEFVYDSLAEDAGLLTLGIGAGEIRRSARKDDVPANQQFVILAWGSEGPYAGSDTTVRPFELRVWTYDREPTYARIGAILDRIKVIVIGLVSEMHTAPDGWITGVEWQGRSADLADDVYEALTRYDTYRLISS